MTIMETDLMATRTVASPLARLSINQRTVRQLSLPELVNACRINGIGAVGLWREPVAEFGLARTARLIRSAGFTVTSLCRGGFFTADNSADRSKAIADTRAALDEAATLGTDTLVLVCGGVPAGSTDVVGAREQVADAIAALAPDAAAAGVRLAIEPLHPMFASDRCVISTLSQALEIAGQFAADRVGVAVDTYHIWWDPQVFDDIAAAGAAGRIAAFQLADWVTPLPAGVLTGRGQLGDGCVDLAGLHQAVDATGYRGPVEVEIFNDHLWSRDGTDVITEITTRYQHLISRVDHC